MQRLKSEKYKEQSATEPDQFFTGCIIKINNGHIEHHTSWDISLFVYKSTPNS